MEVVLGDGGVDGVELMVGFDERRAGEGDAGEEVGELGDAVAEVLQARAGE